MITIRQLERKPEERYRVIDVAKATGLSEGQVMGYFSNRNISVKAGITIEQITQMIHGNKRGPGINWEKITEIRKRLLDESGIQIIEDED